MTATPSHRCAFFVLRAPVFPFESWTEFSAGLTARQAFLDQSDVAFAWERDRGLLLERLRRIASDPLIREALALASPDLLDTLDGQLTRSPEKVDRALSSGLLRYFTRMTSRCTPFASFAAVSFGEVAGATRLFVAPPSAWVRRSRLDMGYLHALADHVDASTATAADRFVEPNSSLTLSAGRYNYAEGRTENGHRAYHLIGVAPTPHLTATLRRALQGATSERLAGALVEDDPEVALPEAESFIRQLLDHQLLVSRIGPPVTDPHPTGVFLSQLEAMPGTDALAGTLRNAVQTLNALDEAGLGQPAAAYAGIQRSLEALPVPFARNQLVQLDCARSGERPTIGPGVVEAAWQGLEILWRLFGSARESPLDAFSRKFADRYGEQEVNLLEALGSEAGIGFGKDVYDEPLLEDIPLGGEERPARWTAWDGHLLDRLEACWVEGATELELGAADWERRGANAPLPLPDSLGVLAALSATGADEVANGNFELLVRGATGPSGGNLLGRFCHLDDALLAATKSHLRAEEACRPDAVFAEIVHVPQGRLANVLIRPALREYEIPFLGRSGVPADRQIPASDLVLALRRGRLVLRSMRLDREVIPRLTTAHNYLAPTNIALYRVLCLLQGQGLASNLAWSWGILGDRRFLPRVRSGRVILALATWSLGRGEIQRLTEGRGAERFAAVQRLRDERRLPRHVLLSEGDQELLIDLDNPLSVEALLHYAKNAEFLRLTEKWPTPERHAASGPQGRFAHELVLPFVRAAEGVRPATVPRPSVTAFPTIRRSYLPGSEWLTAKIYTHQLSADGVLRDRLASLLEGWERQGWIDRWFFLRYGDPDFHLRLRLHGGPSALQTLVFPGLRHAVDAELSDGRCRSLQIDTYEREVERYGGPEAIESVERLFHRDSEAVLRCITRFEPFDQVARWKVALLGVHAMLDDAAVPLDARVEIVDNLKKAFGDEFKIDGATRTRIGNRYRKERPDVERLVAGGLLEHPVLGPARQILARRGELWAADFEKLRRLEADGRLTKPLREILASLAHVCLNRLFRAAPRQQETVLYHFLSQTYQSVRAKATPHRVA